MRTRAADALGKIGGPSVVDAVIQLMRDEDEDVRRAAIEILNQTKDERAVNFLIEATKDKDWWVSERAVDALAEIGSKKAVPRAAWSAPVGQRQRMPTVARALGKLGDAQLIEAIMPLLERPEKEIKVEAIHALARLADDKRADRCASRSRPRPAPPTRRSRGSRSNALSELDNRIVGGAIADAAADEHPAALGDPSAAGRGAAGSRRTTLLIEANVAAGVKQAEEPARRREARHLRRSRPATSSRAATSTSRRSARAPSAPCC